MKFNLRRSLALFTVMMFVIAFSGCSRMEGTVMEEMTSEPPQETPNALADGVYQWFSDFSSSLVVISGDDVLIVDPSNNARAEKLKAFIATLTDKPVSHIVLTHEHYDHVGGTSIFPEAAVYCHVNCLPIFDLDVLGDVPEVDETFTDDMSILVGEKTVELHYLGPGDGDATTIIYMPNEKIVVTADLYEDKQITGAAWVDDKNFTGVRKILNTVSGWDLVHAVNAHSPSTDPLVLRENAQYYNDLYDATAAALNETLAQGGGFGAVVGLLNTLPNSLKLEQYASWQNYDSAFPRHVERMLLSIFHGD